MSELADFVAASGEMAKRLEKDGLAKFQPHKKQQEVIDACFSGEYSEVWLTAANRFGKSDCGAYIGATLARYGNPNARFVGGKHSPIQVKDRATSGWVSALDFPTSQGVVQPKYFNNGFAGFGHEPFIPEHEVSEWRVSDQVLKLKNGSIIGFKSAEQGSAKYMGAEKTWIHFDEVHPYDIYEESTIRVGAERLLVFVTATLLPPEKSGISPGWIFDKIIPHAGWRDGHPTKGKRTDLALFTGSIYDNPYLNKAEIARQEAMHPEGSATRRIRLNGELLHDIGGARAYPSFYRGLHVRKLEPMDWRRPLCWCWDFNVEPMVTTIGQKHLDTFYIHDEIYLQTGSIPEMCDHFKQKYHDLSSPIWIYGDASGRKRHAQSRQSDYTILMNEMRSMGLPLTLKVPESNPNNWERLRSVNRVMQDENGMSHLVIDPSCVETISDYEQVVTTPDGKILKSRKRKDPYFWRTHCSDATDAWIWYEQPARRNDFGPSRAVRIPIPAYGSQKKVRSLRR